MKPGILGQPRVVFITSVSGWSFVWIPLVRESLCLLRLCFKSSVFLFPILFLKFMLVLTFHAFLVTLLVAWSWRRKLTPLLASCYRIHGWMIFLVLVHKGSKGDLGRRDSLLRLWSLQEGDSWSDKEGSFQESVYTPSSYLLTFSCQSESFVKYIALCISLPCFDMKTLFLSSSSNFYGVRGVLLSIRSTAFTRDHFTGSDNTSNTKWRKSRKSICLFHHHLFHWFLEKFIEETWLKESDHQSMKVSWVSPSVSGREGERPSSCLVVVSFLLSLLSFFCERQPLGHLTKLNTRSPLDFVLMLFKNRLQGIFALLS